MIPLPSAFALGPNDVLCGRTRDCCHRAGNKQFEALVKKCLPQYLMATSRMEKSDIILAVIHQVEQRSCGGGFVRYDPVMKQYYRVSEKIAREKTSQAFRDVLKGPSKSLEKMKGIQSRVNKTRCYSSSGVKEKYASKRVLSPQDCSCDFVSTVKKPQNYTEFLLRSAEEHEISPILSDDEFWSRFMKMDRIPEKQHLPFIKTSNDNHDNGLEDRFIHGMKSTINSFGFDFSSQACSYTLECFFGSGSQMGVNRNTVNSSQTNRNNYFLEEIQDSHDDPFEPLPF